MLRLRSLVVPVAVALALPAGVAGLSPVPSVPLYVTGKVLACRSVGGCAHVVTTQGEDGTAATTELGWSDDGTVLVAPEGALQVPVGPLDLTAETWYVSDAIENGRRELESMTATCGATIDVPDDPRGLELTLLTTDRACLLDVAPSERGSAHDAPSPASGLTLLLPLAESVDPARVEPPFVHLDPVSAPGPMPGVTFPLSLGHCGLFSPIDLDGSFWDPMGAIDADLGPVDSDEELGELINATDVEAVRVGRDRMDLRTPLGTVLVLARHDGAGDYPGCD